MVLFTVERIPFSPDAIGEIIAWNPLPKCSLKSPQAFLSWVVAPVALVVSSAMPLYCSAIISTAFPFLSSSSVRDFIFELVFPRVPAVPFNVLFRLVTAESRLIAPLAERSSAALIICMI